MTDNTDFQERYFKIVNNPNLSVALKHFYDSELHSQKEFLYLLFPGYKKLIADVFAYSRQHKLDSTVVAGWMKRWKMLAITVYAPAAMDRVFIQAQNNITDVVYKAKPKTVSKPANKMFSMLTNPPIVRIR